jgi:hypothetical protein
VRVSANFLYYNYDSSGTRIAVNSPGVSLVSGIRVGNARATGDLLGGAEVRRDHRTLDTPGTSATDEINVGIVLLADGDFELAKRWRSYLMVNYAGAAQYWYGRGELSYQLTNLDWQGPAAHFAGVEVVREGNDESDAYALGGFFERAFVRSNLSIGLHAGAENSGSPGETRTTAGYFGFGFYQRF